MKEISISKLRRMSVEEVKDGGCFRIIADGEQVAIVIVGAEAGMNVKLDALASQIDAARGK